MNRAILVALVVSSAAVTRRAWADDQSELDKARNAYLAHQYDDADVRFRAMLDPKSGTVHDPAVVSQAYMYWGAVLLAEGKKEEAGQVFEQLLFKDPHFEPDPLSFPTGVVDAFIDVRTRIKERLNAQALEAAKRDANRKLEEKLLRERQAARVKKLEELASVIEIEEHRSRVLASIPFGTGQFQNGDRALGAVFLGAEALAVAVGAVTVPLYYAALNRASADYDPVRNVLATRDGQAALDQARTLRIANLASYATFAAFAIGGIVQAHVAYVPDVTIKKKRPLPPLEGPLEGASMSVTPVNQGALVRWSSHF